MSVEFHCKVTSDDIKRTAEAGGGQTQGRCAYAYVLAREYGVKSPRVSREAISFRIDQNRYYYRTPPKNAASIDKFDEYCLSQQIGMKKPLPRMSDLLLTDNELIKVTHPKPIDPERIVKPRRKSAASDKPRKNPGRRELSPALRAQFDEILNGQSNYEN